MSMLDRRATLTLLATAGVISALPLRLALAREEGERVNAALLHKEPEIGDMVMGAKDAPVTIVEYASATCPHCANFHKLDLPVIKKEYVDTGKVRFIYREFPLDQLALAAFMIARCAPKEKYFPIIDMLMKTQETWVRNPREELLKIAKLAGMTEAQFDACLKNRKVALGITNMAREAERSFGVNSTPTLFINGRKAVGMHINDLKKVIDEELKKASGG